MTRHNKYPYKVHANVLLIDGMIINFKTGTKAWTTEAEWITNRQPLDRLFKANDRDPNSITSQVLTVTVHSDDEHAMFYRETAVNFYRQFEIHPDFSKNMFNPHKIYEEE